MDTVEALLRFAQHFISVARDRGTGGRAPDTGLAPVRLVFALACLLGAMTPATGAHPQPQLSTINQQAHFLASLRV